MKASFTLPSFAKINLMLRVIGKRPDRFHELFTVFQTISLHDELTFEEGRSVRISCDDPTIPTDERNLITRAAAELQKGSGVTSGAAIHLKKQIPSPGGLGGGSSNAAVTLIGLSRLWDLSVPQEDLLTIARELGADVPFFLTGGTALGTGRGDEVESIGDQHAGTMLIVSPNVVVRTRDAFADLGAPNLTKADLNRILRVCRSEAESLDLYHGTLINDFEASVFSLHPEIKRVKERLLELGAVNAAMSGSGASVFAIFDKTETRQTAEKALDAESTWRKFAVATISRTEYREALRC